MNGSLWPLAGQHGHAVLAMAASGNVVAQGSSSCEDESIQGAWCIAGLLRNSEPRRRIIYGYARGYFTKGAGRSRRGPLLGQHAVHAAAPVLG